MENNLMGQEDLAIGSENKPASILVAKAAHEVMEVAALLKVMQEKRASLRCKRRKLRCSILERILKT